MRQLEKNLKALANRRRLAILAHLKKNKEASVTEIAGAIRLSVKATSKHLAILSAVDVVEKDQRSLLVFYSITSSDNLDSSAKRIIDLL